MPGDDDSTERKSWTRAIARYSAIGLMLPAATFVGWIIGALLDRWLHTTWLYLAGLIFGIAAGFVQLIRSVTGSHSDD
ncbi:MAG: AtpZ/AtpI family protein [Acidobacteriaceae bacterium]|nr:AtpZ/AtpI family protein [Acidobacteriaceae bacterium]